MYDGPKGLWNFVASLTTSEGWVAIGNTSVGVVDIYVTGGVPVTPQGRILAAGIALQVMHIPDMSAREWGRGLSVLTFEALAAKGTGMAFEGVVSTVRASRSVLVVTEVTEVANTGLTNAEIVQKSATLAERAIGGTGGVAGTAKHQYASNLINRYQSIYGNRGLETGVYFNNGVGNRGFLDVIDYTNGIIYDFKFGKAVMSPAQYNKYFNNFGLPIQIIRPQ